MLTNKLRKWIRNEDKWATWYDSLPENTKTYMKGRPIWHDSDMYKSFAIGACLGFIVGFVVAFK